MIDHILHGLILLLVIVFGLPVIISLAMGLIGTGKANFKAASHVMITTLHVVVSVFEDMAEQLAKVLVKRYTKQKKILEPIIKHVLMAIFVLVFLTFLSAFN
jgi:hypothetical protein